MGVAAVHDVVVFQTKRQQHGFFDPLVRHPFAVDFFRDTDAAAVEIVQRFRDGVFDIGRRRRGRKFRAPLPRGVDGLLQTHGFPLKRFDKFGDAVCRVDTFIERRHHCQAHVVGAGIHPVCIAAEITAGEDGDVLILI